MQHVHARQRGEDFAGQVNGGAVAGRGIGQLARRGLCRGHHVGHALDLGLGGVGDQDVGHHGQHAHGREVLDRVIAELAVQRLVGGHADGGNHQRVAVGRGLGHEVGADVAARAGAVLDDEGLAQRARGLLAQGAGDGIHGAARREGHDPANGLARPVGLGRLGMGGGGQGAQAEDGWQGGEGAEKAALHGGCLLKMNVVVGAVSAG
ncbi:hypothetical protein SDC9_119256 [bioreactor metagenome]|uniref:Uncharacterized protein n=1 Tax=bioreactor metagenome TaxID=1076179 RepID=A0A645C8L4_9ZZZZ